MIKRVLLLSFLAGCAGDAAFGPDGDDADPMALTFVAPADDGAFAAGDLVPIAVATSNPDARVVHFTIDGAEIAACDPSAADEDCRLDDLWRWSASLPAGTHALGAWFTDATGARVATSRSVTVGPFAPEREDVADPDEASADQAPALVELAASRGYLDPARGFHNVFGGIHWAVSNQKVVLHANTPAGSISAISRCMARYGGSIRKWADHYKISRASVIATAITESSCTNPAGSSDGLSSGPMQVTASTCASLMGLSRSTCRVRMHTSPDFSFQVGAKYMATSYQRAQHHRDPPKIAAAYNAGSVRYSSRNRWHMLTTGNHIDRWVSAYNGYRRWEASKAAIEPAPIDPIWEGAHVTDPGQLPASAAEGTTIFVGDFASRDGDFVTFESGAWQP